MESKATRICWNSNQWVKPSGSEGKSQDKNSFEVNPGYGHEEWLLDLDKTISGFKYSFLQGINTPNKSHQGMSYKISLYTMYHGKKLCIGHINKVECITKEDAEKAIGIYQSQGWFDEMIDQLAMVDINSNLLIEDDPLVNFNIRFKPEDVVIYDVFKDVTSLYKSPRYKLFSEVNASSKDQFADDLIQVTNTDLSFTEKQQLINARVGQGVFRDNVAKIWGGERCAVTLVNIREILIASHIKPWRDCEDSLERLDGANGLLLCAHIDKLFDQHLLSFEQKNKRFILKVSKKLDKRTLASLAIYDGIELSTHHLELDALSRFDGYMSEHFLRFVEKELL